MLTRRILLALALAITVTALYRLSPTAPRSSWLKNCRIALPALRDIVPNVSCDSPDFLRLAMHPTLLLGPSVWQSRPLFVLSGTALGAPFGTFRGRHVERVRATYVGFVLFNVLALAAAVFLLETLLAGTCGPFITVVLAVALLTNDVVKVLVWSPHLQMLNVLEPLALAWVVHHVSTRPRLGALRAVGYAFLAGLAPLLYGSGFLLLPGLVLAFLWRGWQRGSRVRAAATAAAMAITFAVPVGGWVAYHVVRNGAFYSREVEQYREFVWIVDRFRAHGLAAVATDLAAIVRIFWAKLLHVGWFPLGIFVFACVVSATNRTATRAAVWRARAVVAAALVSLALNLAFFILLGYYSERLSLTVVPPLLLLSGVLLAGPVTAMGTPRRRLLQAALLVGVLGWTTWQARRPGPWSFYRNAYQATSEGVRLKDTRIPPLVERLLRALQARPRPRRR